MSRLLDRRTTEAIEANLGGGTPLAGTPARPSHAESDDVAADGDVRIHADASAADLSKRLGAVAFTFGRDIFLAADAPALDSPAGNRMLGHELTHVQQQRASGTSRPRRVSAPGSPAEREAARSVDMRGDPSAPAAAHTVHREVPEEEEVMTLTSETVHREVPEEEEVMTLTSETVHRQVVVDELEAPVEGTSPTAAAPTTDGSTGPAAAANPAAAALYEIAVMEKVRYVSENLQGSSPDPLAAHQALRDAAQALVALAGSYETSDPALHEGILNLRGGLLTVRETLSPLAGIERNLETGVVPYLPGMVERAAAVQGRLH